MEIGLEVLKIVSTLLPGFVTVGVIERLSHAPVVSDISRIARALTYAVLDYALYALLPWCHSGARPKPDAEPLGQLAASIPSSPLQLLSLLGVAVLVGFAVCYYVRFDGNRLWRLVGMTTRTSRADVWFDVFLEQPHCYAVFHLRDGRRLYGWPEHWPDDPRSGFFFVSRASWHSSEIEGVEEADCDIPGPGILIPREDVRWVEFVEPPEVSNNEREEQRERPTKGQTTDMEALESSAGQRAETAATAAAATTSQARGELSVPGGSHRTIGRL